MNDLLGILVKVSAVMFRIDLILMKALNGMVVAIESLCCVHSHYGYSHLVCCFVNFVCTTAVLESVFLMQQEKQWQGCWVIMK
jgi:hypothetical protein